MVRERRFGGHVNVGYAGKLIENESGNEGKSMGMWSLNWKIEIELN